MNTEEIKFEDRACENTDKELWREIEDDYYSPSIHVTKDGKIGMDVGGTVLVQDIRGWHKSAVEKHTISPDKIIETTDREIGYFLEQLSRIIRNVKLIKSGKTHTKDNVDRLGIIDKCARDINERCCKM